MKIYKKEILIILIQLLIFYTFPLISGPTDNMGLTVIILLSNLILSLIIGIFSQKNIKYYYPFIISILFTPIILIFSEKIMPLHLMLCLITSILIIYIISPIIIILKKNILRLLKRIPKH